MIVVDANILLYAINHDAIHHQVIRRWWETAVNGDEPVGLCWAVILAVLRISTHPGVFLKRLVPKQAIEMLEDWLSNPNVRVIRESDDHWPILKSLIIESGTAANNTSDANLAALAIGHGAILASCDADFARFRGLRWVNPLSS